MARAVPSGSATASQVARARSPGTVQVWVVPHAGHTLGLATAPRAWDTHVISFLNAALHPGTTAAAAMVCPRARSPRRARPGQAGWHSAISISAARSGCCPHPAQTNRPRPLPRCDARIIVLGSSSRTDLPHLPFGSVSHRLLHLARRPVLIVPWQTVPAQAQPVPDASAAATT